MDSATREQAPPIVDHVYRSVYRGAIRTGRHGCAPLHPGMCTWLGTCNRPADDHITTPDYRTRREGQ